MHWVAEGRKFATQSHLGQNFQGFAHVFGLFSGEALHIFSVYSLGRPARVFSLFSGEALRMFSVCSLGGPAIEML